MFFKKTERKKHSAACILAVGALAAVGVLSITRKGKSLMRDAKAKMKSIFCKCDCNSPSDCCGE